MRVEATLNLARAARRHWDVVVVGAGPAGSLAARELARRGAAVLLVDRASFPRWKVCGACLNGQALAVLRAAGLGELPGRLGAVPLRRVCLSSRGRRALVPLPVGVALSREALDASLIRAALAAGADFLPETSAALGPPAADARAVTLHGRDERAAVVARLVLAADGLGGTLLARGGRGGTRVAPGSWTGAGAVLQDGPAFYGAGAIFMACGTPGYVGLVRLEDGRLNVAAALEPAALRRVRQPGEVAAAVLEEAGLPTPAGLGRLAWRGTPPLTRGAPRPAANRLFAVGDAAGYVEPFTGEGIAWALAAGRAVVGPALRAVARWESGLAGEWAAVYDRIVRRRQATCRAARIVLHRPRLTGAAVAVLAALPALARPLLRHLNRLPVTRVGVAP
jgi:flavin-dependent dehydrogenase